MGGKKVFNEYTTSKLDILYSSEDDIIARDVACSIYDVPITFKKVLDTVKNQPFLITKKKSAMLDFASLDIDQINKASKAIISTSKGKETAVIEMMLVESIPAVKFMPSEMIAVGNKKKLAAPRFTIDLSKEEIGARCGVRINTGYIVKINSVAMGKTISNGEIINFQFSDTSKCMHK